MKKLIFIAVLFLSTIIVAQNDNDYSTSLHAVLAGEQYLGANITCPNGYYLSGIMFLPDSVGTVTSIDTFYVGSEDFNGTIGSGLLKLKDEDNVLVTLTVATGCSYPLKPTTFYTWKYINIHLNGVLSATTTQYIRFVFRKY